MVRTKGFNQSRRKILKSMALTGGAVIVGRVFAPVSAVAQPVIDPRISQILAKTISVDMHSHASVPYIRPPGIAQADAPPPAGADAAPAGRGGRGRGAAAGPTGPTPTADIVSGLKLSGFTAVCETLVPVDSLRPSPNTPPQVLEDNYYAHHRQMLDRFDQLHAEGIRRALTMKDLQDAKAQGAPIIIQDSEGMQWLGGHLERIEEAYRRGTRKLQLVHSRNDPIAPLGDLQNPPSTEFHGLTPIGADVIRECNRLGIVVDLAHGNQAMVEGALKVATRPLLVSHTALNSPAGKGNQPGMLPRLVNREHAKAVANANGVVGVWHLFDTMKEYVAEVREMVDAIGADYVGIGTDSAIADATNTMWPDEAGGFLQAVAGEMLKQGFTPDEISKIAGGNFCRVFAKATAST